MGDYSFLFVEHATIVNSILFYEAISDKEMLSQELESDRILNIYQERNLLYNVLVKF